MIVYLNGDFIPKEEARLSLDDRGFLFADGAYEVFLAYDGRLFKTDRHLARMARSLRELHINGLDMDLLGEVAETLIRQNNLGQGNAVVYLQITRGAAPRKHTFPAPEPPLRCMPTRYLAKNRNTVSGSSSPPTSAGHGATSNR